MRHSPWNWYYVCTAPTSPDHEQSWAEYDYRREKLDYIGSDICSVNMPVWWVGIGKYDFTELDKYVSALLDGHPTRYFVPRIKMEPPLDWLKAHPEEVCVYYGGPTTPEEIRDMLGTPQHDTRGWDDGVKPYPDEKISNQSFSSKIWIEDASIALSALVDHIENGPFANQTIGYMVAFGNCGECMWWGDWRNQGDPRKGDFGISHKKHFFEWAVNKYGSLDGLREAWNDPNLTIESLTMPSPMDRWSEGGKDLRGVLLMDDQRQVDCNEFHSKACFDAAEAFGKVVKEKTGKATGCFYGYFQDETVGYAGHLSTDRAMTTPYLDFYSSPKAYHYCLAGDPGASQAPSQSFARKKLWIEENDCRSHHAADTMRKADCPEDTETIFWREIYRALTFKFGFWWMDIGGLSDDWYSDTNLVEMFKSQADFFKKWSPVPRKSVAEVLFVEDEASCGHATYISGVQRGLRLRLERELRLCGAPMDHLRVSDLLETDLSQYKFIVFCHAFVMPKELWAKIKPRLRPGAHVLWNYAAGLLNPSHSPENQKAVTGFNTVESKNPLRHKDLYRHIYWHETRAIPQDYPVLELARGENQEEIQVSPDGRLLTARMRFNGGASIHAADLTLREPILRSLMADAGVNFITPEYCAVLADDKLIGFFPRFDVSITHDFVGKWRNVINNEVVEGKTTLSIREKRFMIFEKID